MKNSEDDLHGLPLSALEDLKKLTKCKKFDIMFLLNV